MGCFGVREKVQTNMNEAAETENSVQQATGNSSSPEQLLQEVERLRETAQLWRVRFLISCLAYVFLFIIAVIQFTATFMTTRLLHESRQDAQRFAQQHNELRHGIREAQEQAKAAHHQVEALTTGRESRMFLNQVRRVPAVPNWDEQIESLDKRIGELADLHIQLSDQVDKMRRQRDRLEKDTKDKNTKDGLSPDSKGEARPD